MDDNTLSSLITLIATLVFLISGWAVLWIYRARRGGWTRLAVAYATPPRQDVLPRRWQSLTLMPVRYRYRWIISMRLTVDGLYLRPILPFRFGHDPILIPWEDIEIFAVETYPADRLYDLKIARVPQVRIRVGAGVAQFIRRAADNVHYFVQPSPCIATTDESPGHDLRSAETIRHLPRGSTAAMVDKSIRAGS